MFKLFQTAKIAYFKLGLDLHKMQFKYLSDIQLGLGLGPAYQQYLEPRTVDQ